ncbi:MAG TPA: ABC transporter ATP-binding protein [Gammaproteobacteria bacterium]|nr:ABC transporter ATP-binding protein [Gammaproteobacteria bacterium]
MNEFVLNVEHLSKYYGPIRAVDDVSFQLRRGGIYGLLGANGAGKTTTLAMLLGLVTPTAGRITIFGLDMSQHRYRCLERMNFSSPYVELPQSLSVRENLTVYARLYDVKNRPQRLRQLAEELAIGGIMDRKYRTLSAGQKTRVTLAKALLNDPDLILLDEPTASLDPDNADRVRGLLLAYQQRTQATVLLSSHNMSEVERICDRVMIMRTGRLVDQGEPAQLIARYGRASLEQVFLDIARDENGDSRVVAGNGEVTHV